MARTRTIKPEFWDDEKLATQTCRDARLTFIGMWNNSDDYGVIKGNHLWIKNQIFPYEEIKLSDFSKWMTELESGKWIMPFSINGEKYYYIRTFKKHQTISRPSPAKNPSPPESLTEDSLNTHGALIDETETETETETEEVARNESSRKKTKYLDSVLLTDKEYKKLQEALGQKILDIAIEKLDYSITVKGGKYMDHYKTLLNWFKRGFLSGNNGTGNHETVIAESKTPKRYVEIRPEEIMERQRKRDAEELAKWSGEHAATA